MTRYLDKKVTTYPGQPTIPNSATGNLVINAGGAGVGADLLSGIGPVLEVPLACNEITISSVGPPTSFTAGDGLVVVEIEYNDPLESDGIIIFQLGTGSIIPIVSRTITGPSTIELELNIIDSLTGGSYALKVVRSSDPKSCFAIKYSAFEIEVPVVCTLTLTDLSGDGVPPNGGIFAGNTDNTVSLVGTGFLSGPLTVTIDRVFGGPLTLPIDFVTVNDDNNLDVQFDTIGGQDGQFSVTVEVTTFVGCIEIIGDVLDEGINVFSL